jgi:hypothetical protein
MQLCKKAREQSATAGPPVLQGESSRTMPGGGTTCQHHATTRQCYHERFIAIVINLSYDYGCLLHMQYFRCKLCRTNSPSSRRHGYQSLMVQSWSLQ